MLHLVRQDPNLGGSLPGTRVLRAEVAHAVRTEMAQTLEDLVRRRTDLGVGRLPVAALEEAAHLMANELGWTGARTRREVAQLSSSSPTVTASVAEYAPA